MRSIAERLNPWRNATSDSDPRHRLGRRGELLAARYLRGQHYRILRHNFRAPGGGEVDLVCRDKPDRVLSFVEVKTRSSLEWGRPSAAVDAAKQRLIIRGAMHWLRLLDDPGVAFRFDVVEVLDDGGTPVFNLIKGAFQLPNNSMF